MRDKSKSNRRLQIERLEDRLVLSVSLQSGPLPDEVILFPAAQAGEFEIATGPAAAESLPVVDLSVVTSVDQRHLLSLSPSSFVQVDVNEQYTLSLQTLFAASEITNSLSITSFDVDKNQIDAVHVTRHAFATDTTLAAALHPGDSSLLIDNASGWSNELWASAETRALAWYGYTNSTGETYADYTYTRHVAFDLDEGVWEPGGIRYDTEAGAYRLQLLKPWDGPTLPVGSAIRNATAEATQPQFQADSSRTPSTYNPQLNWTEFRANFGGGVWQQGQASPETFRPGTVFIQPEIAIFATDVVIGPEQDFSFGAPHDPSRPILVAGSSQRIAFDLDVLGKRALEGVTGATDGDFDADGDRDGGDFLAWQRGLGSTHNAEHLEEWKSNYSFAGTVAIQSVDNPLHGTATIATDTNGQPVVHYQSDPWFVGTDIVRYTLHNPTTNESFSGSIEVEVLGGNVEQNPALVATLQSQAQVTVGNEAPEKRFGDLEFVTAAGQTLVGDGVRNFDLLWYLQDPTDQLVVRLLDGPEHGSLTISHDGTFEYAPVDGFFGVDTFRYEAFDGLHATSAVASIQVLETVDDLLQSHMKKIALAMQNYESVFGRFPVANGFDAAGNPYLSWRVHLLPFLEYRSLHDQFHLDEPWNSANNLPLLAQMPDVFRSVGDGATSNTTRFQTFSGPDAPFGREVDGSDQLGPKIREFADGKAHTLLFVESGANKAVSWSKPDDLAFDANNPLAALGAIGSGPINAVTADGTAIKLLSTIDSDDFKALVTINGDELVDAGTLYREYQEVSGDLPGDSESVALVVDQQFGAIALAMHNYADAFGSFPIGSGTDSLYDANGIPHVSWRVYILPYLGHRNLYDQFHLDEPWDSANNLPLLAEMPDLFRSAGDASDSTNTRVLTLTGPDAAFGSRPAGSEQRGPSFGMLRAGTSNTIMFVEGGIDKAVPWTQPVDLPFDVNDPLASLGDLSGSEFRVAMFDASILKGPTDITPAAFSALVTESALGTYQNSALPDEELLPRAVLDRHARRTNPFVGTLSLLPNKFKKIGIAFHAYNDATGRLPANSFASDGTPLLSWRVLLLPFLGHENLYRQFHRDEPWDSPHNRALLEFMPDIYRGLDAPVGSETTRVMTFTGGNAPFPAEGTGDRNGPAFASIQDGISRTIAFVEAGTDSAVPWTKPLDLPFHTNNPFSPMGDLGEQFVAAFLDAHVETLPTSMTTSRLNAYITRNGGEDTDDPPFVPTVAQPYIRQTAGDTVTHEFGVDWFDVVYDAPPTSQVTLTLSVSDPTIALLDKQLLTFDASNWNIPQRVAVRGVDNFEINEDRSVQITVGSQTFTATLVDDDRPPPSADFDADGDVDGADFLSWQRGFGLNGSATPSDGDTDADADVDVDDLSTWQVQFGTSDQAPASADFDGDGSVNGADFLSWQRGYGTTGTAVKSDGDANADGTVDDNDLWLWQAAFGQSSSASLSAALEDEYESLRAITAEASNDDTPWLADELLDRVFGKVL